MENPGTIRVSFFPLLALFWRRELLLYIDRNTTENRQPNNGLFNRYVSHIINFIAKLKFSINLNS